LFAVRGLPIPVTRTVVAPFSLAISKAFILKVLVPRCENTTTISFFDNTYFDLTKSKLWREDGRNSSSGIMVFPKEFRKMCYPIATAYPNEGYFIGPKIF
jgi:hypothetical protein